MSVLKFAKIYAIAAGYISPSDISESIKTMRLHSDSFSLETLKSKYKALVQLLHPDKFKESERAKASIAFAKINHAYTVLTKAIEQGLIRGSEKPSPPITSQEESWDSGEDHEDNDGDKYNPPTWCVKYPTGTFSDHSEFFVYPEKTADQALDYFMKCVKDGNKNVSLSSDARNWLSSKDGAPITIRKWSQFYTGRPSYAYGMLMKALKKRLGK